MTSRRVILSRNVNTVYIASEDTNGGWSVEKALDEHQVTCLAADGSNAGVVYAGTREQGVWRSSDYGRTWENRGMKGQIVKSLAVSPHDPETLYAG